MRRAAGGTKKVLVVDDQPEVRAILTESLLRCGLVPIPVADEASFGLLCERLKPDAILLALVPDGGTPMLVEDLKRRAAGVPVLVVSRRRPGQEDLRWETGTDQVLPGPINLKRVAQILFRLLRPAVSGRRLRILGIAPLRILRGAISACPETVPLPAHGGSHDESCTSGRTHVVTPVKTHKPSRAT